MLTDEHIKLPVDGISKRNHRPVPAFLMEWAGSALDTLPSVSHSAGSKNEVTFLSGKPFV
jgi:hypothetical protein